MAGRIGPVFVGNIIRDGLVVNLNADIVSSYPQTGLNWYDLTGYGNNATLDRRITPYPPYNENPYPTYYSNPSRIKMVNSYPFAYGGAIILPGNSYTYTTNFTWQIWHYYDSNNPRGLDGVFWSELSKNFLMIYLNVTTAPSSRIDTPNTVYYSLYSGTTFNGGFNSILSDRWELTTIVKNGTTFSWYWGDILKWQVVINDWEIIEPTQEIFIGNINSFAIPSNMSVAQVLMYNRVLADSEISYNYDNTKNTFGL